MVVLSHAIAETRGDDVAVTDDESSLTWSQFNDRANRCLHALRSLGHGSGTTVGVLSGNRHELLEVHSAVNHGGYWCTPVNWHFTVDEAAYVLHDSGATVLLTDADHADLAVAAAGRAHVRDVIVFGGDAAGTLGYEDLLRGASSAEPANQQAGSLMMYTSGTTGRPKGVRSTALAIGAPVDHRRATLEAFSDLLSLPRGGRVLINAPLYHGGPYLFGLIPFTLGAPAVLRRRFEAAETLRLIDEHAITTAYCVPTHFVRLLRLPEEVRRSYDGSSLECVYHTAAACPPDVKRQMIDWWGPVIYETYSATDGGVVTSVSSEEWLARPGTVGRALPMSEVVVVDDDGAPLGPGEIGTIYIRSLIGTEITYYGDPEKTALAHLGPATVTVGDVGYLDEDGYLFLSDRKIDMIISGGVNIYPAEIEARLITHPAVADVAVFGVPDDEFGEEVRAAVVPSTGETVGDLAEELRSFCRETLAGYKVPRTIDFVDVLPRTDAGKLEKRRLRELYRGGAEPAG